MKRCRYFDKNSKYSKWTSTTQYIWYKQKLILLFELDSCLFFFFNFFTAQCIATVVILRMAVICVEVATFFDNWFYMHKLMKIVTSKILKKIMDMFFGMVHSNILKNNIHPLKRKKESLKTQHFTWCLP